MRTFWAVLLEVIVWLALIAAFAFLLSMLFNHSAHSEEACHRYSDVVGGSHPTWSGRVPGHRGEHCWFPDKHSRVAKRGHSSVVELQSSKLVVAGSTPAARSTLTLAEQQPSVTFPYFRYATVVFERWFQPTVDWTNAFDDLFEARYEGLSRK